MSTRKDKKLMLVLVHKKIHFGSKHGFTYIDGATEKQKGNYLNRHAVNEDWSTVNPASLSRFILWGDSRNIRTNIDDYMKRFF